MLNAQKPITIEAKKKKSSKSLSYHIKRLIGMETPPAILPYRGYGTVQKVRLWGHVLDDRRLHEATLHDRKRRNMKAMISRYLSDPLEGIQVEIDFCGKKIKTYTDASGLFDAQIEFSSPLAKTGWMTAQYSIFNGFSEQRETLTTNAEVLLVDDQCEYGIISDVDDTILISHATKFLKKMRLILTKNALTRLPFPGIATFYKALSKGINQRYKNPIFYVSSSEWNLYDFLADFCTHQNIPKGPFLLQEYKKSI